MHVSAHTHSRPWKAVSLLATVYTESHILHYKLRMFFNHNFHYVFKSLLLPASQQHTFEIFSSPALSLLLHQPSAVKLLPQRHLTEELKQNSG